MSHGRERKEKDCLNCGTIVEGRFCQACGQENTEPHETFFGMVNHFFSDITHFDGKFFKTVGILASKPGYLSRQYISGKRNSFLHPVRMYVFTNALFFLVFFSVYSVKENTHGEGGNSAGWAGGNVRILGKDGSDDSTSDEEDADVTRVEADTSGQAVTLNDSTNLRSTYRYQASPAESLAALHSIMPDTSRATGQPDSLNAPKKKKKKRNALSVAGSKDYHSLREYDSVQAAIPASRKDGWIERLLVRKGLDINDRYPGEEGKLTAVILDKFLHTLPYLLFISLPLYGFFLYLLYVRRKRFYFADHAIFLIHLYIFTFIIMLVMMLLTRIPYAWAGFVIAALFIYGIGYTLKAFRNFYGQGWGRTIFKFLLFNFLSVVSVAVLFALFFGYALFQV